MLKKLCNIVDAPLVTSVNVREFGFRKMPSNLKFLG